LRLNQRLGFDEQHSGGSEGGKAHGALAPDGAGGLPLALVVAFGVYLVNFDRSILPQLPYDWPMLAGVTLIITLVLPALAVRSIVRSFDEICVR
jgi:hypothetical protein